MLSAALKYAAQGWRVFPCQPRGKTPRTKHGHNDATTDEAQIRAWWGGCPDANIGLATGDGLAVVDVDDEDGRYELEVRHGDLPKTLEAVTGSGKRHLFYRYDGDEIRSRNGFGRGVDLKADGGYVIVAPSVHPSGGVYTWDNEADAPICEIAPLPVWIRQLRAAKPTAARGAPAGAADMGRVKDALRHIAADEYDIWLRVGMALHHETGGSFEGEALWRAWASVSPKFDEEVQAKKWASFGRGDATLTIATVFHMAREAGHELPGRAAAEEQPQPPLFQVGDEQEVANYVLRIIERDGPTVGDLGALWQYATGEGVWRAIEDDKGRNMVGALWGAQVVRNVDDEGEIETKHWRIGKNTRRNVWDIACEERQTAGFFNDAPAALVFDDCAVTVDASGGVTAHEHSSSFRARVGYPFKFARTACARWLAALAQWFDGDDDGAQKAQLIQEFTGACLFGLAPRYQRAVILFGRGGNGKSTCLDALEAMFPRDAVSHVAPQAMMGNSAEYYLAELRDSRINVVRDMPSTALLQSADFKAAVSGEPLMGRPIGSDPFAFNPKAGHIFGANALPATTDQSTGFWRRWVVVPFFRRFEVARGSEDLARAIVRDELPGMVAWAVEGAANLTARGHYVLPDSHRDAVDAWASNVNPVKAWLEDTCASGAEKWTRFGTLYQNHRDWCQANGVHPVASRKFGERLEALGVERATRKGVKGFRVAALAVN